MNFPAVFPVLTTMRFVMRQLQQKDLGQLVIRCNNENISKQTYNLPFPYTEEFAELRLGFIGDGFLKGERIVWLITEKNTGIIVGEMGLHLKKEHETAELGYWVAEEFWGKGIATEVLAFVLDFGFRELGLHKIFATHFGDNPASGKVMQKCGMKHEGVLRSHVNSRGEYKDLVQFGLLQSEWKGLISLV